MASAHFVGFRNQSEFLSRTVLMFTVLVDDATVNFALVLNNCDKKVAS